MIDYLNKKSIEVTYTGTFDTHYRAYDLYNIRDLTLYCKMVDADLTTVIHCLYKFGQYDVSETEVIIVK